VPAATVLKPQTPSPAAFVFSPLIVRLTLVEVAWKGNAGVVVPRPTPVPLSKSSELPPAVALVNYAPGLFSLCPARAAGPRNVGALGATWAVRSAGR